MPVQWPTSWPYSACTIWMRSCDASGRPESSWPASWPARSVGFEGGTTDSFGPELQAVTNGLGFLPYTNGVHYDSENRRRPLVHKLVADGTLGT